MSFNFLIKSSHLFKAVLALAALSSSLAFLITSACLTEFIIILKALM